MEGNVKKFRRIRGLCGFLMLCGAALAPAGCAKRTQVAVPDSGLTPGWSVTVLEITRPALINLAARSPAGGTMPPKPTGTVEGARWLLARVNLKAPKVGAAIAARQIRLLTPTNAELGLTALTGVSAGKKPTFIELAEADMLGWLNAKGEMLWMTIRNKESGQLEIIFQKAEPLEIYLLFTVPADGRSFRLVL